MPTCFCGLLNAQEDPTRCARRLTSPCPRSPKTKRYGRAVSWLAGLDTGARRVESYTRQIGVRFLPVHPSRRRVPPHPDPGKVSLDVPRAADGIEGREQVPGLICDGRPPAAEWPNG